MDNAATTRPHPQVLEEVLKYFQVPSANPSAVHPWGIDQRRILSQARSQLARIFSVPLEGIVFCGSGTESDNLAIKGSLFRAGKTRGAFVTSPLEHKAVLECARWYESLGGEVRYLKIDVSTGQVDLDDLSDCLSPTTCLVSVTHVHNETGIIQDLGAISKIIRRRAPQATFHSDGVQGFGKILPKLKAWGVDLYSISGHKIHGLVGGAALIRTKPVNLEPQTWGGSQEFGLRSGTENVYASAALSTAASLATQQQAKHWESVTQWSEEFLLHLRKLEPAITRTEGKLTVPHILHLKIPDIPGEVLLHHLAAKGILVSQGSACQAKSKSLSIGLKALGLNDHQVKNSLRFSLSHFDLETPPEDVAGTFQAALKQVRAV